MRLETIVWAEDENMVWDIDVLWFVMYRLSDLETDFYALRKNWRCTVYRLCNGSGCHFRCPAVITWVINDIIASVFTYSGQLFTSLMKKVCNHCSIGAPSKEKY